MVSNHFFDGWKEEVNVPSHVWEKYEQTLENIDILSEERKKIKKSSSSKQIGKRLKTWAVTAAAILAVFVIGGSIACYHNPVLASKFPLIGTIFWQVEDNVSYSGVYSNFEQLSDNNQKETAGEEMEQDLYCTSSNGIKITASEIYSDGFSVYITMKIESEAGGFETISSYVNGTNFMYIGSFEFESKYQMDGETEQLSRTNRVLEGNVIDDFTFIGMLKLDRKAYSKEGGTITLDLHSLSYDNKETNKVVKMRGEWNLTLPFIVDCTQSKEFEVNKVNEDGCGIEKVVVTPYQVVILGKEVHLKDSKEDAPSDLVVYKVFNQDGEELQDEFSSAELALYRVQKKKIKTLSIYACYGLESLELLNFTTEDSQDKVKKLAKFEIEVPVE